MDPDARLVERRTPDDERPEIADGTLRWHPVDEAETEIDLQELFRKAVPRVRRLGG